ncbi:hypothetical protein L3X38_009512 [Prunus dulcis]|uniref:Uncharacterized protein n=1 Tax=Prunus dulcis TaxID=3755 RepID=A0AAD4WFY5_PRUDU|nr:hypothetical protein L3X38_009512 [Prunus dulcis]
MEWCGAILCASPPSSRTKPPSWRLHLSAHHSSSQLHRTQPSSSHYLRPTPGASTTISSFASALDVRSCVHLQRNHSPCAFGLHPNLSSRFTKSSRP